MIDWDKAPEGATHAVMYEGSRVAWTKYNEELEVLVNLTNGQWMKPPRSFIYGHEIVARPAPRTKTDELLDMIRGMRYKAFEMGYREGFKTGKHNDAHPFNPMGSWSDINQQEKQS